MGTFLFDNIVFGPVNSRRLGRSLGINILPSSSKLCNYNCIYCECGFSKYEKFNEIPDLGTISETMERNFKKFRQENNYIDVITFAGNGEPTLHKDFSQIIDETIRLRNKYLPKTDIAVLTNATKLHKNDVVGALNKIEKPLLKIDTLIQEDFELINCPKEKVNIESIPKLINEKINRKFIQTMFFKAKIGCKFFDNSDYESLKKYYQMIRELKPELVMIYSIARDTPVAGLIKLDNKDLDEIGSNISDMGINVLVTP